MAFDIMSLFGAPALNRLLQPAQDAENAARFLPKQPANRLIDPAGLGSSTPGMMPSTDPWAGMREPAVDPTTVSSTGQGAATPLQSQFYDGPPDAGVRPTGVMGAQTAGQLSSGGFLDRLRSGINKEALNDIFTGWAAGGSDIQKSLAMGGMMAAKGAKERKGQNDTVDWLKSKGYDDTTATRIAGNQVALQQVLKDMVTPKDPMDALKLEKTQLEIDNLRNPQEKPTDDIKEYQYAVQSGQFKGSFTDWQTKGVKDQDATFGREQGLRKEYTGTPEYKRFDDVRASYERVRASAARESGAGDLGLIFGFMKMLDPGSVVREGEFANAENTAGVPDRVRNLYNRVISGERLNADQRREFIETAGDLYTAEADRIRGLNERYSGIAGQHQLDPSRIIVEPQRYEPLASRGDPLDEARKAIAAGADRALVEQRLRENGIDPSGL